MSGTPFDLNSIIDADSDQDAISQYQEWKKNSQKEDSPCATVFLLGDLKVPRCLWRDSLEFR